MPVALLQSDYRKILGVVFYRSKQALLVAVFSLKCCLDMAKLSIKSY